MNKKDILEILTYDGIDKDIKSLITRISDTASAIPEDVNLGEISSFKDVKSIFPLNDSVLNSKEKIDEIKQRLETLRVELDTWIHNNPLEVKCYYLDQRRPNDKKRRIFTIILLVAIAALAIICTVLQDVGIIKAENVDIGEIIGLVDMLIGIGSLIYELADDSKKGAVCGAIVDIGKSISESGIKENTDKFVKIKNTNIFISIIHIGPIIQGKR